MSFYNSFFSKIYDLVFFPFLHLIRKKIAEEVTAFNPQNVIDICCEAGAYFIEFLIGGQHYSNFKTYIQNNLLKQYTSDLLKVSEYRFLFSVVRIHTFINNQYSK